MMTDEELDDLLDSGAISPWEEGFMIGYLEGIRLANRK